jgi:hypothetical protein
MTAPPLLSRGAVPSSAVPSGAARVVTPTARRAVRSGMFWVITGALLLAFAALTALTRSAVTEPDRFGAEESAPVGSRALVEVLRDQGVTVSAVDSLDQALTVIADPSTTTLVAADPRGILTAEQWGRLDAAAATLVVVEPSASSLRALAPTVGPGIPVTDEVRSAVGCSTPAALRAQSITADGVSLDASGADGALESCFPGTAGAALISLETTGGGTLHLLGASGIVQNTLIGREGNAALALGLAGEHPTIIWYVASPADAASDVAAISELYPGWVNPLAWLALTVGLAAALWRGRRLGPVVIEHLPVIVKTTETMEGRARLYAREGARLRALDALRVGTLRRLAGSLGLGSSAGVDDIIAATTVLTGRDRAGIRSLLLDRDPHDDGELVRLSDDLLALERQVHRRVALTEATDDHPTSTEGEP